MNGREYLLENEPNMHILPHNLSFGKERTNNTNAGGRWKQTHYREKKDKLYHSFGNVVQLLQFLIRATGLEYHHKAVPKVRMRVGLVDDTVIELYMKSTECPDIIWHNYPFDERRHY